MKKQILSTFLIAIAFNMNAQSPWAQKAGMNMARRSHASVVLDGKIYSAGGDNENVSNPFSTLEVYDPNLNSWTSSTAEMDTGRTNFGTIVVNGKIWAIGGGYDYYHDPLWSIEAYDPISDTWQFVTNMPRAKDGPAVAIVGSKVYIIGGCDDRLEPVANVEIYDTLTKTWTTGADLPTARGMLASVVLDGKIYAIGGMLGVTKGEVGLATIEMYDPITDTWTIKTNMSRARKYTSACVLNDLIYVFGGATGYCSGVTDKGEVYNPATDTWTEICSLPQILAKHSAVTMDEKIYLIGGVSILHCPDVAISSMIEYSPEVDLFPYLKHIEIDENYKIPGSDSLLIKASLRDTTGITLYASIQAPDSSAVDSIQLFDDGIHSDGIAGDSLYANTWPVSSTEEKHYFIDLHATRSGSDTVVHYMDNMAVFTTIGPVEFEAYHLADWVGTPNPGEKVDMKISLRNNGTSATATGITAMLSCLDTLGSTQGVYRTFNGIAPGEIQMSKGGNYSLLISENCPVGKELPIQVDIYSDEILFWTDTFSITVEEPSQSINSIGNQEISVFPNPATDRLTIEFDNTMSHVTSIMLYDITGKVIYSEHLDQRVSSIYTIDLSSFGEGIYFLNISNDQYSYTEKVIKVE